MSPNVAISSESLDMKLLLKLQQAPQILQPDGRICHLGNRNVLLHVLHAQHAVHDGVLPVQINSHHALHDLEVPSLLVDKNGTTRAKTRVKEVVNAIAMLRQDGCGKTQTKLNEKKQRSSHLSPEYSAVLGSHVSHASSSVWT